MHRWLRQLRALVALAMLALPATSYAQQETATVLGTVVDAQNAALPGATVTVRNLDTGFTRTAVTTAEGGFRIAAIPPGNYELSAELAGFASNVRRGVTLRVGAEAVVNFQMALAGLSEQVTVQADVPVVETTTATLQGALRREQMEMLPIAGRNYTNLLRLMPGAAANNSSFSFGGSRGRSNTWVVDGVHNTNEISGFQNQVPALDSIQEVQVLVNGFKAEYGQASGGIVNVITRSGSNDFHGNALFLFQDNRLRARSPYASRTLPRDPNDRRQYGFTLSGPVSRNKLHFMTTYEREDRDFVSATTSTLPSVAQITGASAATRSFLAANDIDISRFGDGGSQRLVRPERVAVNKFTARLDHQTSPNQFTTLRYLRDTNVDESLQNGSLFDYNGARTTFQSDYLNLNHKWILGANRLNEAYVQVGRFNFTGNALYTTFPTVAVSGAFTLGSGTNNNPDESTLVAFSDNFTLTLPSTRTGEHIIKIGGQVRLLQSDSTFDSNFRGTYTFPSMAAFLAGTPSRFTQNQGDSYLERPTTTSAVFVQDDWRPIRSLTLNLGLRYDYDSAKTHALTDVTGKPGPGISQDKNNFSPRFGFAWAPGESTTQVVYGGTGLYYDRIILNIIGNARFTPPKVVGIQIDNPAWPDPFLGGTVSVPAPSLSIIDPDLVQPWNWNSQIGYRRELMADVGLDVSFLYNRGYDMVGIINTNAGIPGTASSTGANPTRPDAGFVNKSFYTNYGEMRYKALVVDLRKRYSRGFQGGLAYTLSKTENNAFNFVSSLQVPTQPDLSWGPDDTDARHRLTAHAETVLPWGIRFGAIAEFRTPTPLNIVANGRDLNGDGIVGDWVNESVCIPRPGVVACPGFNYSRNSVRELSTEEANALRALFGQSAIAQFEKNPNFFNVDLTLQKAVTIGRHTFQLAADLFNAFNLPQRTQPGTSILSAQFGTYTAVVQPRAAQFTLSYKF